MRGSSLPPIRDSSCANTSRSCHWVIYGFNETPIRSEPSHDIFQWTANRPSITSIRSLSHQIRSISPGIINVSNYISIERLHKKGGFRDFFHLFPTSSSPPALLLCAAGARSSFAVGKARDEHDPRPLEITEIVLKIS